jgi:hypothetical protein
MFKMLGIYFITLICLTACGDRVEKWKEEVRLSNGQVVVVERELWMEPGGDEWSSNRSLSKPKEYVIRFPNPDGSGKYIEWKSVKGPSTWPERPLIFDISASEVTVFSIIDLRVCRSYLKNVYRNGFWNREDLPERFEKRPANLLLAIRPEMPDFIDLNSKKKLNADPRYERELNHIGPSRIVCG